MSTTKVKRRRKEEESRHLLLVLALFALLCLSAFPLQYRLTVLIQLQFGNLDFRRVNSDGDRLTVDLLPSDALNVDDIFETVY